MEESCFFIYVYLNGLRANRLDENVFIFSQESYRAVNSDRDLATLFCVHKKCSMTARMRLEHYIIIWGRGDRGFWLCGVAILVKYSNDAPQRIVTKSLYRTGKQWSFRSWILADLVDLDDLPDAAWADVHPASRTRVHSQQHATLITIIKI